MKRSFLVCIMSFLLAAAAGAQNLHPGVSGDGNRLAVSALMNNASFASAGLSPGFMVEDFLYMGFNFGLYLGELGGEPSKDMHLGIECSAALFTQDEFVPLSCTVSGTFSKITVMSAYLEDGGLIRNGTGYSVGADIFRDYLIGATALRIGTTVEYRSDSITEEPETGGSYSSKVFSQETGFNYGLLLGVSRILTEKLLFSFQFRTMLDKDMQLVYGPTISLAAFREKIADFTLTEEDLDK